MSTITIVIDFNDYVGVKRALKTIQALCDTFAPTVSPYLPDQEPKQPASPVLAHSWEADVPAMRSDELIQSEVRTVNVEVATAHNIVPIPPVPAVNIDITPSTAIDMRVPTVELDTDGLPWDVRIHAATKSKNADGRWKQRRGVDPDVLQKVRAELKGVMAIPPADTVFISPVPIPPTVVPPAPATDESPAPANFPEFIKAVGGMLAAKTLKNTKLDEIISKHGVTNIALVGSRPDLIPAIWKDIIND